MNKLLVLLMVLAGVSAQASSLNCSLTDTSGQALAVIDPIALNGDLEKTDVASLSGITFAASLAGKQVDVYVSTGDMFNRMSMSAGSKKKAAIKTTMNGLSFKFLCVLAK